MSLNSLKSGGLRYSDNMLRKLIVSHVLTTGIVLIVTVMITTGYVQSCHNLYSAFWQIYRTKSQTESLLGFNHNPNFFTQYSADENSVFKYASGTRFSSFDQLKSESGVSCRRMFLDNYTHYQFKRNHARNPYYRTYYKGFTDNELGIDYSIKDVAFRDNLILELALSGSWLSIILWIAMLILMVKERYDYTRTSGTSRSFFPVSKKTSKFQTPPSSLSMTHSQRPISYSSLPRQTSTLSERSEAPKIVITPTSDFNRSTYLPQPRVDTSNLTSSMISYFKRMGESGGVKTETPITVNTTSNRPISPSAIYMLNKSDDEAIDVDEALQRSEQTTNNEMSSSYLHAPPQQNQRAMLSPTNTMGNRSLASTTYHSESRAYYPHNNNSMNDNYSDPEPFHDESNPQYIRGGGVGGGYNRQSQSASTIALNNSNSLYESARTLFGGRSSSKPTAGFVVSPSSASSRPTSLAIHTQSRNKTTF